MDVRALLLKVVKCQSWRALYALSESLLNHGLYLGSTVGGNRLLCRIANGKPVHESLFDDYLILGGRDEDKPIPDEIRRQIVTFILEHASLEKLSDLPAYQRLAAFYGKPVKLEREQALMAEQHIKAIGAILREDL